MVSVVDRPRRSLLVQGSFVGFSTTAQASRRGRAPQRDRVSRSPYAQAIAPHCATSSVGAAPHTCFVAHPGWPPAVAVADRGRDPPVHFPYPRLTRVFWIVGGRLGRPPRRILLRTFRKPRGSASSSGMCGISGYAKLAVAVNRAAPDGAGAPKRSRPRGLMGVMAAKKKGL